MNQVALVGRLVRTPELRESENKRKLTWITIAVTRGFRNANGEYETDFIDCILWDNIALNTVKHCRRGDIISIRGRMQSRIVEKNGDKRYVLEVVGEKITFISSARNQENQEKQSENEQ